MQFNKCILKKDSILDLIHRRKLIDESLSHTYNCNNLYILLENGANIMNCVGNAIIEGNLDVLELFYHHNIGTIPKNALHIAIEQEHLHIVKWLCENNIRLIDLAAIQIAVELENPEIYNYLHSYLDGV